jgi:exopolyphosphatase/guanosine-5'-triphosphate,3'-diphosphate pyrophosphatase
LSTRADTPAAASGGARQASPGATNRVAIIDVGTNTTRLLVADVVGGRVVAEHERTSKVTRLGAGVDGAGRLADDALAREYAVLTEYAARAGSAPTVAVMTSAVRDAENGAAFAAEAASRYGFDVRVLSGEDEAKLTYRGATDDLGAGPEEDVLVIDIGGGSTELVIGRGSVPWFHVSTQAGVVRQADRHIVSDPPSAGELAAVAMDVRATFEAAVPVAVRARVDRAIAVAGTPTSLAAIAMALEPYDSAKVHGYTLTAGVRDAILARLAAMPLAERRAVPGLHPGRALPVLPGIVILREVMDLFGLEAVQASEHDILRGAAAEFAGPR